MGARAVVGGVVGVVVLAGGLLVVDRYAQGRAESAAVERLGAELQVTGTPTVDLGGFPFLPELLAGSLDDVTAHADGLVAGGTTLLDVDATATGVTTSEPYTAGRVELTGTVPTATLQEVVEDRTELDAELATDGGEVVASGSVLGLRVAANLAPVVVEGRLELSVTSVSIGGVSVDVEDLPGALEDRLRGIEVPLDGLPDGLTLTGVQVVATGARVTATGTDLALTTAP
jgi:hypothetical protein